MTTKALPQAILATTRLAADLDAIVSSAGCVGSRWQCSALSATDVPGISSSAGVYCFVLPEAALPTERALILHGRTFGKKQARRQIQIRFDYQAIQFAGREELVVYVGKAANLRARIKGHLSTHVRATTNQVLRGLVGGPHTAITSAALERARSVLQKLGSVHLVEHFHPNELIDHRTAAEIGECLVAERDLLEIKLIAKYAPPFNIKAER